MPPSGADRALVGVTYLGGRPSEDAKPADDDACGQPPWSGIPGTAGAQFCDAAKGDAAR
jgi:hypothetical protein